MKWVKVDDDSIVNLEHARALVVQVDTGVSSFSWTVIADFGDMRVPVARFSTREKALAGLIRLTRGQSLNGDQTL